MKFITTKIQGVFLIEPSIFRDERGYFLESFKLEKFKENIGPINFVQDNESRSSRGVIRGLHFQEPPYDQAKLVRCIKGIILDVAVDIRKGSPTFGHHISVRLTEENKRQLFIPKGFAHGFSVLSDIADVAYKVDNGYAPESDSGIRFDDKDLNIDWHLKNGKMVLSKKDLKLAFFKNLISPFHFEQ